jgi:hypothetical protein
MLGLAGTLALAQEFSADVVNQKSGGMGMTKIYAGKDKLRLEMGTMDQTFGPVALILDEVQRKPVALMTERHMYMDYPPMLAGPVISQFWRVADVNDACPQWKKVSEQVKSSKFGTCTKIGSDGVNGRSAVKYKGVSTDGKTGYVWVDTKLHCVVKLEDASGNMELRNIHEGAQPASLFEIPAGYTKFDMGAMMRQRQQ